MREIVIDSFGVPCLSWSRLLGLARVRPPHFLVVLQIRKHALHPLAHHSRFVHLSGLVPTDPAAQEHELLCRAIEFSVTFDQLQGAELSCFELLARRSQMLEMKHRDKVAGSLLEDPSRRTVAFILASDAHVDF